MAPSITILHRSDAPYTPSTTISHAWTPGQIKLSTAQQQAERDWKCATLMATLFTFAYIGRWLAYMLLSTLSITTGIAIRFLLLLLLNQDFTTLIGTGLLLWIVFGGHQYLSAPACLRRPDETSRFQPTVSTSDKTSHLRTDKQHESVTAPPAARLSIASINTLDIAPLEPAVLEPAPCSSTVVQKLAPIVEVAIEPYSATIGSSAWNYAPILIIVDFALYTPVVALTIVAAETAFNKESLARSDRCTSSLTYSDMPDDGGVAASITPVSEPLRNTSSRPYSTKSAVEQPIWPSELTQILVNDESYEYTIKRSDIKDAFADPTIIIIGDSIGASGEISLHSVVDTFTSDQSTKITASDSAKSSCTPPSSDDGGIAIERCSADDNKGIYEDDSANVNSAVHPSVFTAVDADELTRLLRVRQYPTFHEGPLDDVENMCFDRRHGPGVVYSQYNYGETASNFTGIASSPDRPVLADTEDIRKMLEAVQRFLPEPLQSYIDKCGTDKLNRARDGLTGLNMFSNQLELLWHQRYPSVDGMGSLESLDAVRSYQMVRTRNYRPACSPGLGAHPSFHATHRQYLTGKQDVMVNQGCIDYKEPHPCPRKSGKLREIERCSANFGANNGNPVLGWLDAMEGADLCDANAYLPCTCGKKAMDDLVQFRYSIEPGYQPSSHTHDVPQPSWLDDDAVEEDRKCKALEHTSSDLTGNPRSQAVMQGCALHVLLTNKPWILMEGFDDPNDALTGTEELPVPGFTELTKYPPGFRMPYGFTEVEHELLPPRCEHGLLHPPFTDHCMRCFPSGEHEGDCLECNQHGAVPAIMQSFATERDFELVCKDKDRQQFERVRKAAVYEKECVAYEQKTRTHSWGYRYGVRWPQLEGI